MLRVKKGNQEFRIHDDELTNYLKKGFDLIDERGQVITLGTNEQSVEAIARENKELRRRNRQLEEGIQQRDRTIAELRKGAGKSPAPSAAVPAVAPEADVPEADANAEAEKADPGQGSLFDGAATSSSSAAPEADADKHICPECGKECASVAGLAKHRASHNK